MKDFAKKRLLGFQNLVQVDLFYMARGSFWTTISFVMSSIFSLALIWAFGNLLSKETYGLYRYILSISGAIGFLTFSGLNTAVTQAVARGSDSILPYAVKVQAKWNQVYLLASLVAAGYYWFQGNTTIAVGLAIIGALFPLTTAMNSYGSYLVGKKDFKTAAFYGMISNLLYSAAMIFTLFKTENILFIIAVYGISNFLLMLIFYRQTLKRIPTRVPTEKEKKELFHFGKHISVTHIFSTISQYVDKIVIFHFLGPVAMAVYGLAMAIPERIRGYTKNIGSLILPRLSEKDMREIIPAFYKRSFQCLFLGVAVSLLYIWGAPYIYRWFLPQYLDSILYSQVISLSFIFTIPGTYMGTVFNSQKLIKTIYLSSLTAHISKIVLLIIFGAFWGVWGVIIAMLGVYMLGLILNFFLWSREVKRFNSLRV